MSQVRTVLFELTSLLKASGHSGSLDHLLEQLGQCHDDRVAELAAKGAKIVACTQGRYDVLYVPMGWVACERAQAGMITMGARKSFMIDGDASKEAFKAVIELYAQCTPPRPAQRLEAVTAKMSC